MISRYSRPEMASIWSSENKFLFMQQVEIQVAEVQAGYRIIPKKAFEAIKKKSKFSVSRIEEIEKKTKHDVIAFVTNLAENVGEYGRYIHYGMTSSDVLDTAFSLQVIAAAKILSKSLNTLEKSILKIIKDHGSTICAGRTHGMFAEPTTFGFKMAGFYSEFVRDKDRFYSALDQFKICKMSGAVGTHSYNSKMSEQIELKVAKKLGLRVEPFATQVIPRDRHAELLTSLAFVGSFLERLAIELRHLQRSDVAEVIEGFSEGQKGSSAMPHKKNPISAENITGLARLLKSYSHASFENISLWHERDISHSSVERVIFPDAFIVVDYAVNRMATLLDGLFVDKKRMLKNLESSQGNIYSSHLLLSLVDKGILREEAYSIIQKASHGLQQGESLKKYILQDENIKRFFSKKEIDKIFSGEEHLKAIKQQLRKVQDLKMISKKLDKIYAK